MARRRFNWYKLAREINDVETLACGDPSRIMRRARNKLKGRPLGRGGIWRTLCR